MIGSKKLHFVLFLFFITFTVINLLFFLTKYILLEKETEQYFPKVETVKTLPVDGSETSLNTQALDTKRDVAIRVQNKQDNNKLKQIAIVIDDLGIRTVRYYLLDLMENKINLAIMPGEEHSLDLVKYYKMKRNCELLMHMPMEPFATKEDKESGHFKTIGYKYILTSSDSKKDIRSKLDESFDSLLGAAAISGINNHMGSYVTSSRNMVNEIVRWSKRNKLYVLDSLTSPSSVFYEQARKSRVKAAYNQVYLDNIDDSDYIKKQLEHVQQLADKEGQVIAIGHINKNYTMEVLFEWMPLAVEQGYTFVFVSELAQ